MHGHDFLVDVDVNVPNQVTSPAALNIGIVDGVQVDNFNTIGANRLLVFSGIAVNSVFVGHDDNVARGVVRVRLQFPVPKSMIFKTSATLAALAGLHGEGDEDLTFSVDAAVTVTDPTDGGTLPQPPHALPNNELYAIIDVAYQGDGSRLTRVSYQANVLVQDLEPDIDSILVRPAGNGPFAPSAIITVDGIDVFYDFQLNLTGPVLQGENFGVLVNSSDQNNVPLKVTVFMASGQSSTNILNQLILGSAPVEQVVLTATGKYTSKTATLRIVHLT